MCVWNKQALTHSFLGDGLYCTRWASFEQSLPASDKSQNKCFTSIDRISKLSFLLLPQNGMQVNMILQLEYNKKKSTFTTIQKQTRKQMELFRNFLHRGIDLLKGVCICQAVKEKYVHILLLALFCKPVWVEYDCDTFDNVPLF